MDKVGYLKSAQNEISRGNLLQAKKILHQAVIHSPRFFLYHERLGDVIQMEGAKEEALKHYIRALELKKNAEWISQKIDKMQGRTTTSSHCLKFCGIYDFYPNDTKQRMAEGGLRTQNVFKKSSSNNPLITIVTAVYNNDETFQRCIDSVKAQTYPNVEYIVIDGGSPQGTQDILRANEDFIDYYVSEPDMGIYSAMNKGIRLARGEYICLLNSDDFYELDFVEKTLYIALETPGITDVVYTDYHVDTNLLVAQKIDEGLLFGHLHVCHNTFLTSRECYNRIGPYDEDFKIVSDAVWMRKAFRRGVRFQCLNSPLFTLTAGGMSSGNTEARRKLFISEVVQSYRMIFPQLSEQHAEEIYLFRFNKGRTKALCEIAKCYMQNPEIILALRGYAEHCMRDRANFCLNREEANSVFPEYVRLADLLGMDKRCLKIQTKQGLFSDVLKRIDAVLKLRKVSSKKTVLHFVSVFSAPPETFIYDLLNRLEADTDYDNFVLFEHAKLREERPFDKAIQVFWNDFEESVAIQIYKYLVDQLKPNIVIAHFALNEWKWNSRIKSLNMSIPTITMCHGIDAFAMRNNLEYRNYLVDDFSQRSNTAFTAVSDYLRRELTSNGIPDCKIALLHNTVHPRFFEHRKTGGFYDGSRSLKLLCVGRLIQWKGHDYLIRALKSFRKTCFCDFHLTIVYGNGADQLDSLQTLIAELELKDNITLEPFVNFQENPEYFAKFDCYIHPSIYSDDKLKCSETFGVAVLEAITAGLPVITSDAGGLAEVIGPERRFARVVPHANAEAISDALADFWKTGDAFADNRSYALDRLERFSERTQLKKLSRMIERVTCRQIKAALFSTSTIQGAGYAAFRVHKGLRHTSVEPQMFTTVRNHEEEPDVTVLRHPSVDNRNWAASQLPPKTGLTIFTLNQNHIKSDELLRLVEPYDIVNLHWHARFLSVDNIAALTRSDKPVVMTIRDMMPLTGGCHCFHGCNKWRGDCVNCPQLPNTHADNPSKVLKAKREKYDFSNLTIVTISNNTRGIIKKAPYFNTCRIETIPNSIETDVFCPHDKMEARREFDLPLNRKIIGYVPSFSSEVKGYREIMEAFRLLKDADLEQDPFIMLVGNETPVNERIEFDKKALGYISDNKKLARAYSAADLVVVPSLEETFSNTTAEAISCGVPVVGFKTGAIPDLAVDGKTGYTYEIGDVKGLAEGIRRVLTGPDMSANCRRHAESLLSFMIQARKYEELYHTLIEESHIRGALRKPTSLQKLELR